jgi:hypothetical protein
MRYLITNPLSLAGRIHVLAIAFALVLAGATLAGAVDLFGSSTISLANPNDPNTWPATFDGVNAMGPYAWVDGPTHLQKDPQLTSGVFVGQVGDLKLYVARAKQQDGVHPGKFYNGTCSIGWGGKEVLLNSGYELLVNTKPELAKFLSQTWVNPSTPASATFHGGSAGTTPLRVCRASYNNGMHAGKEWSGQCYIGFGGQEVAVTPYEVLSLGFDKTAWQAAQTTQTTQTTQTVTISLTSYNPNDPNTWAATFDGVNQMGPYAWVDGPTEINGPNKLSRAVSSDMPLGDGTRLYVCRAKMDDGGFHPGKFFNGMCNVGWGGGEKAQTSGYELLVNTKPDLAPFLSQTWVDPSTPASATFTGGSVNNTPMRVARAAYVGGWHLGKEWAGKCNIGYGGREVAEGVYQVLSLGFDKSAWFAAKLALPAIPQSQVVVGYLWTPDNLGTGLTTLADRIPSLLNTMIDKYNAAQTDPALRQDRQAMVTALKNGNPETQGIIVTLMVDFAKSIVNRDPATRTPEERTFIEFLQALGQNQRQKAGGLAEQAFNDWQLKKAQEQGTSLFSAINPAVNPPPEILAMAKAGYAVTPDVGPNVAKIAAASGSALVAVTATTAAALTGFGATLVNAVAVGSSISVGLGGTGAGIGAAAFGAGAVAVVALMVTSGVLKGIEVFQYEDYKKALSAAIADSKNPVSAETLKSFLNSDNGQKAVLTWLTVQAATGSK